MEYNDIVYPIHSDYFIDNSIAKKKENANVATPDLSNLSREERRRRRRATQKYRAAHATRERVRVEAFNIAFARLRELLPTLPPDKKLSKIEILRQPNVSTNKALNVTRQIYSMIKSDYALCRNLCCKNMKYEAFSVCSAIFNLYIVPVQVTSDEKKVAAKPPETDFVNEVPPENEITPIKKSIKQESKIMQNTPVDSKQPDPNQEQNEQDDSAGLNNVIVPLHDVPKYSLSKNSDDESHIFSYFVLVSSIGICGYLLMYNKKKVSKGSRQSLTSAKFEIQ